MSLNYDRILPIVGEYLLGKIIGMYGAPEQVCLLADMYARMGISVVLPFSEEYAGPELVFRENVLFVPEQEQRLAMEMDLLIVFQWDSFAEDMSRECPAVYVRGGPSPVVHYVPKASAGQWTKEPLPPVDAYSCYPYIGYYVKYALCRPKVNEQTKQYLDANPHISVPTWSLLEDTYAAQNIAIVGTGTASWFIPLLKPHNLFLWDPKCFSVYNLVRQWCGREDIGKPKVKVLKDKCAHVKQVWQEDPARDGQSIEAFKEALQEHSIHCVVLSTGDTKYANHLLSEAARSLGIPVVIPSALPSCLYWKVVIIAGEYHSNCYSCYQGSPEAHTTIPWEEEARSVYYGGTQPASIFETFPSVYFTAKCVKHIIKEVHDPFIQHGARSGCFLGGNVLKVEHGKALYGICWVGQIIPLTLQDLSDWPACRVCGNLHGMPCFQDELCAWCGEKKALPNGYCCEGHKMLAESHKAQTISTSLLLLTDDQ